MKLNQKLMAAALSVAVGLGASQAFAQNDGGDRPQRNRPPGDQAGGDRGPRNFDPAEMQKRMMERYKEAAGNHGRHRMEGHRAAGPEGDRSAHAIAHRRACLAGAAVRGGPGGGGLAVPAVWWQANPEAEALQKAIDAKASNAEMKAALAKYIAVPQGQAGRAWKKRRPNLRKVLTPRQEAIAALNGLL